METLELILLADNDENSLFTITDILQRERYQCIPVRHGLEAIQALEAKEFDLLISEVNMPGNKQLELVQAAHHFAEKMPVILFTGYPSMVSQNNPFQSFVSFFLIKPFEISVLLDYVKTSITEYQTFRRMENSNERSQSLRADIYQIDLLVSAIEETIQVLESTRSSCKSKKLAALRRKLERLLSSRQPE